jgi:hypothetical protein
MYHAPPRIRDLSGTTDFIFRNINGSKKVEQKNHIYENDKLVIVLSKTVTKK